MWLHRYKSVFPREVLSLVLHPVYEPWQTDHCERRTVCLVFARLGHVDLEETLTVC